MFKYRSFNFYQFVYRKVEIGKKDYLEKVTCKFNKKKKFFFFSFRKNQQARKFFSSKL